MKEIDEQIAAQVMGTYKTPEWEPSERIDHAWEAVDKLDLWSMEWHKNGDPGEPLWYDVTIWPDPENPSGGVGGTLCEALCNALLAAVKDQPQ